MHPRNQLRLLAGIAIDPSLEVADKKPRPEKLTESGWSSREVVANLDDAYSRLADAVERRDQQEISRINAELEELEYTQDYNPDQDRRHPDDDLPVTKDYFGIRESKKAKKDWDGDGKVESEEAEHKGVVDKAIKKKTKTKKKKKVDEGITALAMVQVKPIAPLVNSKKVNEGEKYTGYSEWEQAVHTASNGFVQFEDEGDSRLRAVADNSRQGYSEHGGDDRTIGLWDDERGEGIVYESSYNYDPANHETWEEDESEPVNVSGDDDNTVWKSLDKDKCESPSQLDALGNQSSEEHDQPCVCPASTLSQLKDTMTDARSEADKWRNSYSRYETTKFYDDYANACEQLHDHLSAGTVGDMKKAQIHMSSLMGPMLHKIPDDVNDFVMRGGQNRSLKDHFTKVQGYPIEGPRNKLS